MSTLYHPHVIGGAEKAAATMAEALARQGHEVVVICLHPEPEEKVEIYNGVRVYRLPLDNWYWPYNQKEQKPVWFRIAWHLRDMLNLKAARRVGKILDAERPDVVNTHNIAGFSVSIWATIKSRKIRLVHTIHDYYLLCARYALFRDGTVCTKRCTSCKVLTANRRSSSRLPDAVISVSEFTLAAHTSRNFLEGVQNQVIYNIQPSTASSTLSGVREGASDNELVFGFIGRVEQEKGIETLLLATDHIAHSHWKLRIAGRGVEEYVDDLKTRFPDPRIEWLGFSSSQDFYSSVDVVVIPSLWSDPLPYVCVESLRAGKPMICALSGGIPEIARLQPVVEFFAAGDSLGLASKMDVALTSPENWRDGKIKDVSQLDVFNEQNVVAKYLQVYKAS